MNISDDAPSPNWFNVTQSDYDADTTLNHTIPGLGPVPAILEALQSTALQFLSSPSTKTWDLKLFWAFSIPLAIGTILLPLVVGTIIRMSLRIAHRNRYLANASVITVTAWYVLAQ